MPKLFHRRQVLSASVVAVASSVRGFAWASPLAPLRIGQSLPLTGPFAAIAKSALEGQRALLDEVNREGGVRGRAVELLLPDDGADTNRVITNLTSLIQYSRVLALFGLASGPAIPGALRLINEHRIPLLAVYNGADTARAQHHPYLFTTTASIRDEVTHMVKTLSTLNTKRLGLAVQDNPFGRELVGVVRTVADAQGVELTATVLLQPDGSNASAATRTLATSAIQTVLLLAAGPALVGFIKAARKSALPSIYAWSFAGGESVLQQLGTDAHGLAITQVVPYPWRRTTGLARRFNDAMQRLELPVNYERFWGYLNAAILVEALRRAGTDPTPASLIEGLEGMTDVDLGGYRLRMGSRQHHGSNFVEITMIDSRGKYVR